MEGHGLFSGMKNWKLPEMENRTQIMAMDENKKKIKEWPDKSCYSITIKISKFPGHQDKHL